MKDFIKKNLIVLLAFVLPIALLLIVVLSIYMPSFFLSTDYDFLYTSCSSNNNYSNRCGNYLQGHYFIVDNKLAISDINPTQDSDKNGVLDINENYVMHLFLHDTKNNESREVTLKEAQTFTLNHLITSPDGVSVSDHYQSGSDFSIFGRSSSNYGYYLSKGGSKKKLHLINSNDRYYYRSNFEFIGWVIN